MPYYKFEKEDVLHNVIKAYPKVRFDIYGGKQYYNGAFKESGSFTGSVPTLGEPGFISLFELNVDRSDQFDDPGIPELIYGFLSKGSDYVGFKTVSTGSYNQADYGDQFNFYYPLSASLTRRYFGLGATSLGVCAENRFQRRRKNKGADNFRGIIAATEPDGVTVSSSFVDALRNSFDSYVSLSSHFAFSASNLAWDFGAYDKGHQELNMIDVPSIFYGSSIKKGSVSLKWYVSGTLMAECVDREENGELIQVSGSGRPSKSGDTAAQQSAGFVYDSATGSVAGVVLYKEGIIALTGTWRLNDDYADKFRHTAGTIESDEFPKWTYFALGLNDLSQSVVRGPADHPTDTYNISSSFSIEFQGTTKTPVMTMLAHAPKRDLNFSNNPTFISGTVTPTGDGVNILTGSRGLALSSSVQYKERDTLKIKNIVSSSFTNHTASFEKHTYISKIGVYDKSHNLIAIAKLATPVKKTEERDLTFKLKLDI